MRILVVFNPVSGRGLAAAAAESLGAVLRHAGHEPTLTPTRLEPAEAWLDPSLAKAELMVVLGGDGAVRMVAPAAMRTGTPLYHFPQGTENLFARAFGMNRDPDTLLQAIRKGEIRRIDVGTANGELFLLMASIGFDAEVVHDLSSRRGKSISHVSYLPPIMRQLARWRPPLLEIEVDGRLLPSGQRGFIVVGNSLHYGWRLNPCGRAIVDDGLLDVAFFPTRSRFGLALWALRCRMGRHLGHRKLQYHTARTVRIRSPIALRYQLDGDPPRAPQPVAMPDQPFLLELAVQPGRLAVLVA